MDRRAGVISAAAFAGLLTIVLGVGLAWACTPPQDNIPDAGATAPNARGEAPAPSTQAPSTGATGTSGESATTGSGTTSGATSGARARTAPRSPARGNTVAPVARRNTTVAPVQNAVARTQFAQRVRGGTAGVTRSGGQTVFASTAAKSGAKAKSKRAASRAASPSARSASADMWKGFKPQARSSVFAAEGTAAQAEGQAPVTAALLALGLGLVGLMGSAAVLATRRRKAHAKASRSSIE